MKLQSMGRVRPVSHALTVRTDTRMELASAALVIPFAIMRPRIARPVSLIFMGSFSC
jgi:hypothetical protein